MFSVLIPVKFRNMPKMSVEPHTNLLDDNKSFIVSQIYNISLICSISLMAIIQFTKIKHVNFSV